ncbi:MAG: hypothetical protein ACTSR8_01540 [Promethearchaeota archaeon]
MSDLDILFVDILMEEISEDLTIKFQKVIANLESLLYCSPIALLSGVPKVVGMKNIEEFSESIFNFGVERKYEENTNKLISLTIDSKYAKFLSFLLLREAFYCFIPPLCLKNDYVPFFINEIIEIILHRDSNLNEWKKLIRSNTDTYEYFKGEFYRIEKFFKLKGTRPENNGIPYTIQYIREHSETLERKQDFFDPMFNSRQYKISKNLYNDDIVETLRILFLLFSNEKTYRSQIEYIELFKKYKRENKIESYMGNKKFARNFRWIRDNTEIAPSYDLNKYYFGYANYFVQITYHPKLTYIQAIRTLKFIPYITGMQYSFEGFSINIMISIMLIDIYKKDFFSLLDSLKEEGIISSYSFVRIEINANLLNLNYFREFHNRDRILSRMMPEYRKQYEIAYYFNHQPERVSFRPFSLLEWYVYDRCWRWSTTGFSFSDKSKTLSDIRNDLRAYKWNHIRFRAELQAQAKKIYADKKIQDLLENFILRNKGSGFYIVLEKINHLLKLMEIFLEHRELSTITNLSDLKRYFQKNPFSFILEDNLNLTHEVKKTLYGELFPLYCESKEEFSRFILRLQTVKNFLNACNNLKILDLEDIIKVGKNKSYLSHILESQKEKFKKLKPLFSRRGVRMENIDAIINRFLAPHPPIINPYMVSTIVVSPFSPTLFTFLFDRPKEIGLFYKKLIPYVPKSWLKIDKKKAILDTYTIGLTNKEKIIFISALNSMFEQLKGRRYFFSGFFISYRLIDYYDLIDKSYVYISSLYKQIRLSITDTLKDIRGIQKITIPDIIAKPLFLLDKDLEDFYNEVSERKENEQIDLSLTSLNSLKDFYHNFSDIFKDYDSFKQFSQSETFQKYIYKIKVLPIFQRFGISKYYTLIRPISISDLDLRLLLQNNFISLKTPLNIGETCSLYMKNIFPHQSPNLGYINWLSKSKKNISEYCVFFPKKIHNVFHFDTSLGPDGWYSSKSSFKYHVQRVLFDKSYKRDLSKLKTISVDNIPEDILIEPTNELYKDYLSVYNPISNDLINKLQEEDFFLKFKRLLDNDLIIPQFSLKKLGLTEKFYFFFPNLEISAKEKLISIFSFFNLCQIFEIQGHFFIFGEEEIIFEEGLFIKLYYPDLQFSEILQVFLQVFEALELPQTGLISDLGKVHHNLYTFFENKEELKIYLNDYNLLKNLHWNSFDKKFNNLKFFDEFFTPIYQPLIQEEEEPKN